MKIASNWKLTFDPGGASPVVFLDFGDWMDEELLIQTDKGLDVVPLVDSAAPFLRPSGNATYQLAFATYRTEADDDNARVLVLNWHNDIIDSLGRKPLRLDISGRTERYYTFGAAFVTSFSTRRELTSAVARYRLDFSITATSLTKTIL